MTRIFLTSIGPQMQSQKNKYKKEISDSFLQAVENCGLDQIVDFPTRGINLLDIFLTNRPSLIQTFKSLPGISDHEIVYMESDVSVKYQRPVSRKVWLWFKADVPSMKADMNAFSDELTDKHSIKADIDTIWSQLSRKCTQIMTDYIRLNFLQPDSASHGLIET